MKATVQVRAPSRLHFGMFGFGHPHRPQFGGVGVMVDSPTVTVTISPASHFQVAGTHTERVTQFARMAIDRWKVPAPPCCQLDIRAPADHTGLGVGTQLSLAVATGLRRFLELPNESAVELAASLGRGGRSAVGTYGFARGGLIVDGGKYGIASIGRLVRRAALPENWRFVLVRPTGASGLAGAREAAAFTQLPPVPEEVTHRLWQITNEGMLPALEVVDCQSFGTAVYEFGRLAGTCFESVQGGPFAGARITNIVSTIREFGVSGVGQSSWGPTVFAIVADVEQAGALADWLRKDPKSADLEIVITRGNNSGAVVDELNSC